MAVIIICIQNQLLQARLGEGELSPPHPVKLLKLFPRFRRDSRTSEWRRILQKDCPSLSHSHMCVHTHLCSTPGVGIETNYIRAGITVTQNNAAVKQRKGGCSQMKPLAWGWKGEVKRMEWYGWGWQGKAEPQQEADRLSHVAVWISPVYFPILHLSIAHHPQRPLCAKSGQK